MTMITSTKKSLRALVLLGFLVAGSLAFIGCAVESSYGGGYYHGPVYEDDYDYDYDDYGNYGYNGYLSGYGEWVYLQPYGRVWRPYVTWQWHPFVYGHWAWTRYGWTWLSYEPFGWIVYHYGGWGYSGRIGWFWVPGYRWSPARVHWYYDGTMIGWRPIEPYGYRRVSHGGWYHSHSHLSYGGSGWTTVRLDQFTQENIANVGVVRRDFAETRTRGRSYRSAPPDVREIEHFSHRKLHPLDVHKRSFKLGDKRFERLSLPRYEKQRAHRYRIEVERNVLKPSTSRKSSHRSGSITRKDRDDRPKTYRELPQHRRKLKYREKER